MTSAQRIPTVGQKTVSQVIVRYFQPRSDNPFIFGGFPWHREAFPKNCEGVPVLGGAKAQLWRAHPMYSWDERKKLEFLIPGFKEGLAFSICYMLYDTYFVPPEPLYHEVEDIPGPEGQYYEYQTHGRCS